MADQSSSSAPAISDEALTPVQTPISTRILTALPDFGIAVLFLTTWIAPRTFGDQMVGYLMLVMLLEFIIVHSSGFMGSVMLNDPLSSRTEPPRLFRRLV